MDYTVHKSSCWNALAILLATHLIYKLSIKHKLQKKKYTSYFGKAYGIECSALGQIKLSIISTFLYANNLVDF